MKIGVIIQARMGSTRLPGKVLRLVNNKPLLEHVVGRLQMLSHIVTIVVATSILDRDSAISEWCKQHSVECFRGSEEDVLDRYLSCAQYYNFEVIARLTADNPFTDISELDRLLELHIGLGYDYTHSFGLMPIGVGAEIFSYDALLRSHSEGRLPHHREHVNEYIPEHPELFRIGILDVPQWKIAPELRLTVDSEADWLNACQIAKKASSVWLSTEEAIALCLRSA